MRRQGRTPAKHVVWRENIKARHALTRGVIHDAPGLLLGQGAQEPGSRAGDTGIRGKGDDRAPGRTGCGADRPTNLGRQQRADNRIRAIGDGFLGGAAGAGLGLAAVDRHQNERAVLDVEQRQFRGSEQIARLVAKCRAAERQKHRDARKRLARQMGWRKPIGSGDIRGFGPGDADQIGSDARGLARDAAERDGRRRQSAGRFLLRQRCHGAGHAG